MEIHKIAAIILSSLVLGLLVETINGMHGLLWLPILALLCVPTPYFSYKAHEYLVQEARSKENQSAMIDSFEYIIANKGKEPLLSSIRKAISLQTNNKIKAMLANSYRRMMLGKDAVSAFNESIARCGCLGSYFTWDDDVYAAIAKFIDSYKYSSKASNATKGSVMQRYATLNMFLSAIAPSFIVFLFVGSSIISSSYASLLALSVVLLVVVPLTYAFGMFAFERRFIG